MIPRLVRGAHTRARRGRRLRTFLLRPGEATFMLTDVTDAAFPKLDDAEMRALRPHAAVCDFADGEIVFRVGDAELDLFVVESGALDILNPTNDNSLIVTHEPGQ